MTQSVQYINKDIMFENDIDVEQYDFSNDQTWLCSIALEDDDELADIIEWIYHTSPMPNTPEHVKINTQLLTQLDRHIRNERDLSPDKQKFDSRTFTKPKKRMSRPSLQQMVEGLNQATRAAGMVRLKTFNLDIGTENNLPAKEFTNKRKSFVGQDDEQLEDMDSTLCSSPPPRSQPIHIDLTQPAARLQAVLTPRAGALSMLRSGDSFMNVSPPSLLNSAIMDSSGQFGESLEAVKTNLNSLNSLKTAVDDGREVNPTPTSRESLDPQSMMSSMTLSILDDKDMSTSFLSEQTADTDSLIGSLPPSMPSSVNSSFHRPDSFAHLLEPTERLLNGRPRVSLFKSFTKYPRSDISISIDSDNSKLSKSNISMSETDSPKDVSDFNPNSTKRVSLDTSLDNRTKYENGSVEEKDDAEKENVNGSLEDSFLKDNSAKSYLIDLGRPSLNVTMNKQELNEITQAKQKLSLARNALPMNAADNMVLLPNQTVVNPKRILENVSELLSRRKLGASPETDQTRVRESPRRNATFKMTSPPKHLMDTTIIYVKPEPDGDGCETITLANNKRNISNMNADRKEQVWEQGAMGGSSDSLEDGSSASRGSPPSVFLPAFPPPPSPPIAHTPPLDTMDDLQRNADRQEQRLHQVMSTPLVTSRKPCSPASVQVSPGVSPIVREPSPEKFGSGLHRHIASPLNNKSEDNKTYLSLSDRLKSPSSTNINTSTMVRCKGVARRDILARTTVDPNEYQRPVKKTAPGLMVPPLNVVKKTGLPTSKLRQYSSHKELSRIPAGPARPSLIGQVGRVGLERRAVFASNPALSPTAGNEAPLAPAPLVRRDSYVITPDMKEGGAVPNAASKRLAPKSAPAGRFSTDTFRRPHSQLVAPRDMPISRPSSVSSLNQLRGRQLAPQTHKPQLSAPQPSAEAPHLRAEPSVEPVKAAAAPTRLSALPRPSRLPAPGRTMRPPSVYTVAPTTDQAAEQY